MRRFHEIKSFFTQNDALVYREGLTQVHSAAKSQKAVSAYFTSKQILPFRFVEQHYTDGVPSRQTFNAAFMLNHCLRRWPSKNPTLN